MIRCAQRRFVGMVVLSGILFSLVTCSRPRTIIDTILRDSTGFYHLDTRNYPLEDVQLPIGIFDSGTGGLTVLNQIISLDRFNNETNRSSPAGDGRLDFAEEHFIYLGDQANMPYGAYPEENNTELLREHIIKDVQFLLGNRYYLTPDADTFSTDKRPVKAVVIACNTATAYGKDLIGKFLNRAGLPLQVIGIIDAGARAALDRFHLNEEGSIGVLATVGTVSSDGYGKALREEIRNRAHRGKITVFQQGSVGIAGAIDGAPEYIAGRATTPRPQYRGPSDANSRNPIRLEMLPRYDFDWREGRMLHEGSRSSPRNLQINSVENYITFDVVNLLEQVRSMPGARPLKAIILGCTHFPFYEDAFRKQLERLSRYQEKGEYIYRSVIDPRVVLIDPAVRVAEELYSLLGERRMFADSALSNSEFYISVPNRRNPGVELDEEGFFTYKYKYTRRVNSGQEYVRIVPFSRRTVPEAVLERLGQTVPAIQNLVTEFHRHNGKLRSLPDSDRIK